jgi:serine/threonine protein kinase
LRAERVVVKFVTRYGLEAHRALALENLAPQLIHYGKLVVRDGDPSYGDLHIVVMEYIPGMTLAKAREQDLVPSGTKERIRYALRCLHGQGFVFGDLRPPNVLITKNGEIKLIDFDWAGRDKQSRYPLLMSPVLSWPDGVGGLSIMEAWHDNDMLEKMFTPKAVH